MPELIRVRASALAELFDCPARYEAKHLLGMRMASNGRAHLGTSLHSGTAAYDQALLDRSGLSIDDAVGVFVDALHSPAYEVNYLGERPRDLERIGIKLTTLYCKDYAPRASFAAVEMPLGQLALPELGILLTGTLDRIRVRKDMGGKKGIADLKSGKRAVGTDGRAKTAGHAAQLGVYQILAEQQLGEALELPGQIIGLNATADQERIGTGIITGARELLVGDEDSPGLLEHAGRMLHSGSFYPNPRSQLCDPKYCPRWATCKAHG